MCFSKKQIQIVAIVLVSVMGVILLIMPISAQGLSPDEYNAAVYDQAFAIHQKYGIDIRYPLRADGYAAIGTGTLETLEKTLSYMTPAVVSQLSRYYNDSRNSYLTVRFTYVPQDLENLDINALGRFHEETATIELFIPEATSSMTMSGSSPIVIAHEFGHAFYQFFVEQHGKRRFQREWNDFQGDFPYSYNYRTNPDRFSYISQYATVGIVEDFAETFAYAFISGRDGLGFSQYLTLPGGRPTQLSRKISYIQNNLSLYLYNTAGAKNQINRSLGSTPTITYRKLELGGNSLEYIDFAAPHGILTNILTALKIEERRSQWVPAIGGWEVDCTNGGEYLIFPGASFVTLKIPNAKRP